MSKFLLMALGALCVTSRAWAACVAIGPVETAQWIYKNERSFLFEAQDRAKIKWNAFLSPRFEALLRKEWKCAVANEGLCNLDADPWTNAQDGYELPPISFALKDMKAAEATVQMKFNFGWPDVKLPKPVPATVTLQLIKSSSTGCWLLDELTGMGGQSLRLHLQKAHGA